MRLSTDAERDEPLALETIAAAVDAGITVFDTAHAYGHGAEELGHNERLVSVGLRDAGAASTARVVTKGGMGRPGGAWVADGRAKAIRADCEASLEALDGVPIDLHLVHAPDPRTPWQTTVRALARLVDDGLVRHVGVSNVTRRQLDQALELAPIAAVEVAINPFDDRAIRGGVLERCVETGIAVIAHSPLGGPGRAGRLGRLPELAAVAEDVGATPAEVALAWVLDLSPAVIAIPGARRPESVRSAVRAAELELDDRHRDALANALGRGTTPRPGPTHGTRDDAEVVLVMGIPGAGKSTIAMEHVARGYVRLNRDERGGTLRALTDALDGELRSGARRVVLDNTYLTRATRNEVLEVAHRHGIAMRCIWLDVPLDQAQANLVRRLLERCGSLPSPEELKRLAKREPGVLAPTSQMRALRELEPPSADEGFAAVEVVPFVRAPAAPDAGGAVFVGASALDEPGWEEAVGQGDPGAPHLVLDWRPGGAQDDLAPLADRLAAVVSGPVEHALCPHPGGPPICWCRPPLPGLPLAFAHAHGVDPARSVVVGTSAAHRTLATTLGARFVGVGGR
jgi:aryl-alcohol dehydrogenase-like predicted oxidoreductase